MLNNSLQEIIQCNIEISNPASDDATFDSILLIVAPPTTAGTEAFTSVISIEKEDDLLAYGYTASEDAYIAAQTIFSQSPSPSKVFLYKRKVTESTPEDIATALATADAECDFYGFHLTSYRNTTDIRGAVSWAESHEKLYGFEYTNIASCPVETFTYFRSFGVFSGIADGFASNAQPKANEFASLAMMAKCFGYQSGIETWNLKELRTITPSLLSSTQKNTLKGININMFLRYAGKNVTIGGKTLAGEWIDVIRFRDWLKAKMQINVFNVLQTNIKVPFTDNGIGLIQGAIEKTLLQGQEVGGIARNEIDSSGQTVEGYTISVPRALDLTEADRNSRVLPNCKYKARLAGAIHLVEIQGFLTK